MTELNLLRWGLREDMDMGILTQEEAEKIEAEWLVLYQATWTDEMELEYLAGDMNGEI
jgi:hypothetical protein